MKGDLLERLQISTLGKLADVIRDIRQGLDPHVIAGWYRIIEAEARKLCPEEYRESIVVEQDPVLWMKFELKLSRRAVPYLLEAIENHLPEMPFATRLYFQKLEEIIEEKAAEEAAA